MTKKERAQVVELLRCAADNLHGLDTVTGFGITGSQLGYGFHHSVRRLTCDALIGTVGDEGDDWRYACLEAAQRVEDGTWPRT